MSKPGGSVLLGFKYFMTVHGILAERLDKVIRIYVGEKIFFIGETFNENFPINFPEFFQGGGLPNGLVGSFAVEQDNVSPFVKDNYPDENPPQFRGVVSIGFWGDGAENGFYVGNSRQFPNMSVIGTNAEWGWYPEVAPIASEVDWTDMNPVCYIRNLTANLPLTFGPSWEGAADTIFAEGLGLSMIYNGNESLGDFIDTILEHINAVTYFDRQTGEYEIKLIRNDYDEGSLPVFDRGNTIGDPQISRKNPADLPNTMGVNFTWSRKQGKRANVTQSNGALAAQFGRIATERDFPFITKRSLALSVLQRELATITSNPAFGEVRVIGLAPTMNIGSEFILDFPERGEPAMVCSIQEIIEGGPRDNSTLVRFVEHAFNDPETIEVDDDLVDPPDNTALPTEVRSIVEMPYYIGQLTGGDDYADALAASDDFGTVLVYAQKPNGLHTNYAIHATPPGNDTGNGSYSTAGTLSDDITRMQTVFEVSTTNIDLTGKLILLGGEYIVVDSVLDLGSSQQLTVGRGCLDTAPIVHTAGAVFYYAAVTSGDAVAHYSDDVITYRLRSRVSGDILHAADALTDNLTYDARAIRPYPPGQFKTDGSYTDGREAGATVALTWAHRDRELQLIEGQYEDHDEADIGPETGTTYIVRAEAFDGEGASLGTFLDSNEGLVTSYTYTSGSEPSGTGTIVLSVASIRDGYESWTAPEIRMLTPKSRTTHDDQVRLIADGTDRKVTP